MIPNFRVARLLVISSVSHRFKPVLYLLSYDQQILVGLRE